MDLAKMIMSYARLLKTDNCTVIRAMKYEPPGLCTCQRDPECKGWHQASEGEKIIQSRACQRHDMACQWQDANMLATWYCRML